MFAPLGRWMEALRCALPVRHPVASVSLRAAAAEGAEVLLPSGVPAEVLHSLHRLLGPLGRFPQLHGETHCWHSGKDTEGIFAVIYQSKDSNSLKEFWEFRALKIKCRTMLGLIRKIVITEDTDWPWHKTKKEADRCWEGERSALPTGPTFSTWRRHLRLSLSRTTYMAYVAEIHAGSFTLLNTGPSLQKNFWAP